MDIERLKQKVLDLAIKGKLVPQNPNDEPASELIKKIHEEKQKLIESGKLKKDKNESYIFKGEDNCYYEKIGNEIKNITEEIPFEIPSNWCWARIGTYSKIITDFVASGSFASLNQNVKYYKDPNYAILVRTCDFKTNFSHDLVYTDKHGYDFLSNSNLFGGELLLSNIGASIGKVFIVPALSQKMTLAPNSIIVKLINPELNKYLYYVFISVYGQKKLRDISFSSAQAKFNKTDFKKLLIPIPPHDEQLQIIKKLDDYCDRLNGINDDINSINDLIELIKVKILDYYFGNQSPYKSYYENTSLKSVCRITMGQSVAGSSMTDIKNESTIEFHQGKLAFGDIFLNHSYKHTSLPKKIVNDNSIVICVRAPVGDVNITKRQISIGRGLCGISSNNVELMYLYYYLLYMGPYYRNLSQGSTFASITVKTINETPFLLCDRKLQIEIVTKIDLAFEQIKKIKDQLI